MLNNKYDKIFDADANNTPSSTDEENKEFSRNYVTAIFIMFGIVMTHSFYKVSPEIIAFDYDFDVISKILFVNIVIICSWIGYIRFVSKNEHKILMTSVWTFLLDIGILFSYYILIMIISNTYDSSIKFITDIHHMIIVIFSLYLLWDYYWVKKSKSMKKYKVHPKFIQTLVFLVAHMVHYMVYYFLTTHYPQDVKYIMNCIATATKVDNWDIILTMIISASLIILYRFIKPKSNNLQTVNLMHNRSNP